MPLTALETICVIPSQIFDRDAWRTKPANWRRPKTEQHFPDAGGYGLQRPLGSSSPAVRRTHRTGDQLGMRVLPCPTYDRSSPLADDANA